MYLNTHLWQYGSGSTANCGATYFGRPTYCYELDIYTSHPLYAVVVAASFFAASNCGTAAAFRSSTFGAMYGRSDLP